MNATKYGITAQSLVLCNENPDAYEELRQAYYKQFLPIGQAEIDLCDEMIAARWRIRRYSSIETALLDLEMLRDKAEVDRQIPGITSPMRCGLAFRKIAQDDNALTLLSRREAQAQRAYKIACDTLMRMQANRPDDPENEEVQIEPENAPQPSPDQSLDAAPPEPETQPDPAPADPANPALRTLQIEPENATQLPPYQPLHAPSDPGVPSQPPVTVVSCTARPAEPPCASITRRKP